MSEASATSMSLPYGLVLEIISEYLNAKLLRVPHTVTDLDCCDRQCINVGLELAQAPAKLTQETPRGLPLLEAAAEAIGVPASQMRNEPVGEAWSAPGPVWIDPETLVVQHGTNGSAETLAAGLAGAEKEDAAVSPTDSPKREGGRGKRIGAELKAEVLRRRSEGEKVPAIAASTGISEGSCYEIIAEHRRFERTLGRPEDLGRAKNSAGAADVG